MPTTVIHSPDPVLLSRFMDGLKEGGVRTDDEWNEEYDPVKWEAYRSPIEWIVIADHIPEGASFLNHDCGDYDDVDYRPELTADNFDQILAEVVERHKK